MLSLITWLVDIQAALEHRTFPAEPPAWVCLQQAVGGAVRVRVFPYRNDFSAGNLAPDIECVYCPLFLTELRAALPTSVLGLISIMVGPWGPSGTQQNPASLGNIRIVTVSSLTPEV